MSTPDIVAILLRDPVSYQQILALADDPVNASRIARIVRARKVVAYWHAHLTLSPGIIYIGVYRITITKDMVTIKISKTDKIQVELNTFDLVHCDIIEQIYQIQHRSTINYHIIWKSANHTPCVYAVGANKPKFGNWNRLPTEHRFATQLFFDTHPMTSDEFDKHMITVVALQTLLQSGKCSAISGKVARQIPNYYPDVVKFERYYNERHRTYNWTFRINGDPYECFSSSCADFNITTPTVKYVHSFKSTLLHAQLTDYHIRGLRALQSLYNYLVNLTVE